jgi:hypothetical protein
MKILVISDSVGNVKSVAVPNPELRGRLQLEVEDGPTAREVEVDDREIRREDLLGEKGAQAQERALHRLRELI